MACIFCDELKTRSIGGNDLADVILDGFPVTEGHSLVIPKRHVSSYFELTSRELDAVNELLVSQKNNLLEQDSSISGFNVGINVGVSAGQTIFHCHVHLIPRREGDVVEPRGGVRGVIPEKQRY